MTKIKYIDFLYIILASNNSRQDPPLLVMATKWDDNGLVI